MENDQRVKGKIVLNNVDLPPPTENRKSVSVPKTTFQTGGLAGTKNNITVETTEWVAESMPLPFLTLNYGTCRFPAKNDAMSKPIDIVVKTSPQPPLMEKEGRTYTLPYIVGNRITEREGGRVFVYEYTKDSLGIGILNITPDGTDINLLGIIKDRRNNMTEKYVSAYSVLLFIERDPDYVPGPDSNSLDGSSGEINEEGVVVIERISSLEELINKHIQGDEK